jgi:hypothetical protein
MSRIALSAALIVGCSALNGCRRQEPAAQPGRVAPSGSARYGLCEQDTHCGKGLYCSAGVCDLDCSDSQPCPPEKACDSRGRCLATGEAAKPPAFQGHLSASVTRAALTPGRPTQTLQVWNDGPAAIARFHLVSDSPGVTVTPSNGSLAAGQGIAVRVDVAPGFSGNAATVHALSTGGKFDLAVSYQSDVQGRLEGAVDIAEPFAVGSAPVAIELAGTTGRLSGVVDGTRSLPWPVNAPVSATDDGVQFKADFHWTAASGESSNPLAGLRLQRTVALVGTHLAADPGAIHGSYEEFVDGLPGGRVHLAGTFFLRRVGAGTHLVAADAVTFAPDLVPLLPTACACSATSCAHLDEKGLAEWFFAQAFPFESWANATHYQPGGLCQDGSGSAVACLDPTLAYCALGNFAALGGRAGETGMVDVWRAAATLGLLAGKDSIARVLQPDGASFGAASLAGEIAMLQQAMVALGDGLHLAQGGGGLLAPRNLAAARGLDATPFVPSARDRSQLEDLQRFGGLVGARLFAASEAAGRLQREGAEAKDVMSFAQAATSGALIDLAALGEFSFAGGGTLAGVPDGGSVRSPIEGLAASFKPLAEAFRQSAHGLNPAGYPADFVPFDFNPEQPDQDLFQQMARTAEGFLAVASTDEQQLLSDERSFDQSADALSQALEGVQSEAASHLADLCGTSGVDPVTLAGCGGGGGQIAAIRDEAQAAQAALAEARDRLSTATQRVGLLQQQLQNEMQSQAAELEILHSDGNIVALVASHRAQEQFASAAFQCADTIFHDILTAGLGGLGGCSAMVGELMYDTNADAVSEAYAHSTDQIEVTLGQNLVRDDQLKEQVLDAHGEADTAAFEVQRQVGLFDAAVQRISNLLGEVEQAILDRDRRVDVLHGSPVNDPSFRLYRDDAAMRWGRDLDVARRWTFLATRAFEYSVNTSYGPAAEVFADRTAAELTSYLTGLRDAYDANRIAEGWDQERKDEISLRQDVLKIGGTIVDPVTGQTVSPQAQFATLLCHPSHRDANGNLVFKFSTSVAQDNGLFSTGVCGDRVEGLKVNLVGSQLGGRTAYLTVQQAGKGTLRSCHGADRLVSYDLSPKTALVPAGINLGTTDALPENTDLFERPVASATWRLVLDQHSDPRNAGIDVAALEDIEIEIRHRGRSIQ